MLRNVSIATVLLGLCVTFVSAETIKGAITKIDANQVTVAVGTKAKAYDLDKACKFYELKNGLKVELKDGVRAAVFQKLPATGLNATVTTNLVGRVSEVTVTASRKAR